MTGVRDGILPPCEREEERENLRKRGNREGKGGARHEEERGESDEMIYAFVETHDRQSNKISSSELSKI